MIGENNMVHYFGYMVDEINAKNYSHNVPGNKKMHYVRSALLKVCDEVKVFSACRTSKKGVIRKKEIIDKNNQYIYYRPSAHGGFLFKVLDRFLFKQQLSKYIRKEIKDGDTVVIYHSVRLTHILIKLLKKRKVNTILEVEELYGYGASYDNPNVDKEIEDIKHFKKHIFVNDILPEFLKVDSDYTVCYGVYDFKERPSTYNRDKIRVVYAGTIENSKVGAYTAVEMAKHLSDKYELHIAGFGTNDSIEKLKGLIEENNKNECCQIIYHGKLDGDDLSSLLFSCEIGLSTYVIRLPFSNCVFPSKLTTYVCHGLKVVIGRAENFERARIAEGWVYYEDNKPESIATAVEKAANAEQIDCSKIIKNLETEFNNWLKNNI